MTKPLCVMGKLCIKHRNIIHGKEAEELRCGIEDIIINGREGDHDEWTWQDGLRKLLDTTDAGDSLAYLEAINGSRGCDIEGCEHHANESCPCSHPPGDSGVCAGCNCCDL
jgi:hypothetical protein